MSLTFFLPCVLMLASTDSSVEFLWPGGAPGAKGDRDRDKPSITICLPDPEKANRAAVIICPGGGYQGLAMDHEGRQIAKWLNERGIAAFILRYRLGPRYNHPVPMWDVQRAIRTVRARAAHWKLDSNRIGVWGFSAGGHLASTAATHFDKGNLNSPDEVERVSCRPDFAILCYPVISMKPPFVHRGSRRNLLGRNADAKLIELLSTEEQVTKETPPTFLFHTATDKPVPVENSIQFFLALRRAGVPAELHVYEEGPHGVGLGQNHPQLSSWPRRLEQWLGRRF